MPVAAEKPEAVRGLLRAITKGIRDTVQNPGLGAQLVIRRNDVAKLEVELERLQMTLEQNVVTQAVKQNGIGGIDKARWDELAPLMAEQALASGSPGNNPRVPDAAEIVALYDEVYG